MITKYTSTGRKKTKDELIACYLAEYRVKCKCGHTVILLKDKTICTHCGHWIYKDKKTEFMEKLKYARKNSC